MKKYWFYLRTRCCYYSGKFSRLNNVDIIFKLMIVKMVRIWTLSLLIMFGDHLIYKIKNKGSFFNTEIASKWEMSVRTRKTKYIHNLSLNQEVWQHFKTREIMFFGLERKTFKNWMLDWIVHLVLRFDRGFRTPFVGTSWRNSHKIRQMFLINSGKLC